jgi:hypothetical protein
MKKVVAFSHLPMYVVYIIPVHLKLVSHPQCKSTYPHLSVDFVRLEQQSVIKFLTKEGRGSKVIHEWILDMW